MDILYACIRNEVVVEIKVVNEENPFIDDGYDYVFDVTNNVPAVVAGWTYENGQLISNEQSSNPNYAQDLVKMEKRFKFGNQLSDDFIKLISIRNLELGLTSQQVTTIITTFVPIEMALRKCAIPTALGEIMQMAPSFPQYSDLFNYAIEKIQIFLEEEANG